MTKCGPRISFTADVRERQRQQLAPLFDYLHARGISKTWLATQLNMSLPRLLTYETATVRMPPWLIERACRVLGIPESWIAGEKRLPPPRRRAS